MEYCNVRHGGFFVVYWHGVLQLIGVDDGGWRMTLHKHDVVDFFEIFVELRT